MRRLRIVTGSVASAAALSGAILLAPASAAGIVVVRSSTSGSASCPASVPGLAGQAGGITWASSPACAEPTVRGTAAANGAVEQSTSPSVPFRNNPPLKYFGGKVAGLTGSPGELTVTPVYWVPAGASYAMPADYESLINRFVADMSMDNGAVNNVFAALTQYTDADGAHIHPHIHSGAPITDSAVFPDSGCTPDAGKIWRDGTTYSKCITNDQLITEAKALTTAKGLPNSDLGHLYLYFLPKGVETCLSSSNGAHGGFCSINAFPGFCAYHAFLAPPLVANFNYAVIDSPTNHWTCGSDAGSNTGGNQTPNNNIEADTEISLASHEIAETITDPTGAAWLDSHGYEIGDECAYIYGDSSTFQGTPGHLYNQTIHNNHYFIQEEFSNDDYLATASHAYSCIAGEDWVKLTRPSGKAGTSVSAAGGGFITGETIALEYQTRVPKPMTVTLCTAKATATGLFSCSGHIPTGTVAGPTGIHAVTADGEASFRVPKVAFTLGT